MYKDFQFPSLLPVGIFFFHISILFFSAVPT
jgi:hypothetical protein